MKEMLIRAAISHFENEAVVATANLEVYLNSPAAVGEHPDMVQEVINLTKIITQAKENVKTLENLLSKTLIAEING